MTAEMNTDMERRIHARIPTIEQIRAVTCQPGMSIGVIHHGQEIFKYSTGVLDLTTGQKPDSDTLYCIASLSKAFMAASLDLLVQEKKTSWDSTINSIIPEFKHVDEPSILANMTLQYICSHRTGLLSLDEITQGLDARILIHKKDVVQVCNTLPVKHGLRTHFLYNNAMYELAGNIVERVSGKPTWGDFYRDRIFDPLGMSRTTAFRSVHKTDSNIATPYMILTDGSPCPIAPTELSADSMNGGSGGVRSSVNDLLKWCKCLLKSFDPDSTAGNLVQFGSPIWNRANIADPQCAEYGDYCVGWCHHRTPAKLGLISPNRSLESPTLGSSAPSLLLYSHQGDVPGYTCNIYIMPETNSAIVILSNGTGLSDATDWVAQDLIQTMYGLCPEVDFVGVATRARIKYLSHYTKDFKTPLEENRRVGTQAPCLQELTGSYVMNGLDIVCLGMTVDPKHSGKLRMRVNKQPDQDWDLSHYHFDVYCHLPDTYDECLSRGLDRTLWSSFLISFTRDSKGSVHGLCWKIDGVDVHFSRTSPS